MNSENEKALKDFFSYAKECRCRGIYDFAEIASGYRRKLVEGNLPANASEKRLMRIITEFLTLDPKYQRKLL